MFNNTLQSFGVDESQQRLLEQKEQEGRCARILRWICCLGNSEGESDGDQSPGQPLVRNKPESILRVKNELVMMGSASNRTVCLVRITQRNFFVDYQQKKCGAKRQAKAKVSVQESSSQESGTTSMYSSTNSTSNICIQGSIYFSLYELGIKMFSEDLSNALPEKVYRYLVQRNSNLGTHMIFVDGMCRHGASLIHFASDPKFALLVGYDSSESHLRQARHNAQIYHVRHKMEFIQGPAGRCNLTPDLIFMKPDCKYEEEADFCLEQHLNPSISVALEACVTLASNALLVLPKFVKLEQLAAHISNAIQCANRQIRKVEIQVLQIDGILSNYVVYLGDNAKVQDQDEVEFMTNSLLNDGRTPELQRPTYELITTLVQKQGFYNTLQQVGMSRQRAAENGSETALQIFLNMVLSEQVVNRTFIRDFYRHEDMATLLSGTPQFTVSIPSFNASEQYFRKSMTKQQQYSGSLDLLEAKEDEDVSFQRNSFTNQLDPA